MGKLWSNEELFCLREKYGKIKGKEAFEKQFPGRKYMAILKIAEKHGISGNHAHWTDEEILVLKKNYVRLKGASKLVELLPNRSISAIRSKAEEFGFQINTGRNDYVIDGDFAYLVIERRNGDVLKVVIDIVNLQKVLDFGSWVVTKTPSGQYYVLAVKDRKTLLHRFLMNAPDDIEVDHRDLNPLNNTMSNIRFCTHAENNQNRTLYKTNTSGVRGVIWYKPLQKWRAQMTVNYQHYHLGYYDTKEEAACVVQIARAQMMPFSTN